jgi:hypothetical protein
MAITINNTPKVALSGPVGASVSTNAPAAAFGSLQADATLRTGAALDQSLQSVADAFAVREEEDNLRIAKDLEREFVDYSNLLMYGDGTTENIGYMNLKGQLAVDAGVDAAASLAEYQAATLAQYEDNARVTELYTDSTSTRIDGSNIQIMGHVAVQRNVVTVGASDAYKGMVIDESLSAPMNSDLTESTLAAIAGENAEMAILSGISAQQLAAETQAEQSAYLLELVKTSAVGSTSDAVLILAENVDLMSPVDANAAEKAINVIRDANLAEAEAARIEDERLTEEAYDNVRDTFTLTQINGEWNQLDALAAVNNGSLREDDYNLLVKAMAPSAGTVTEQSSSIAWEYENAMRSGVEVDDWRSRTDLNGDDKRLLGDLEREIRDAGGWWMDNAAAQQAVDDVRTGLLPGDLDINFAPPAELTDKIRNAERVLSDLIKGGMAPDTARVAVLGGYAKFYPTASIAALSALPPVSGLPSEVFPTKASLTADTGGALNNFNAHIISGQEDLNAKFIAGEISEDAFLAAAARYAAYVEWANRAGSEYNAELAYENLSDVDKAAVENSALATHPQQ